MFSRNCIESQTSIWLRPLEGSNPHVGIRDAISMVHIPRLQKFHLALKMLLSNALWQPVTTLPT